MFPDRIIFPKAPVCSRDAPESDSVSVVLFASRDVSADSALGPACPSSRRFGAPAGASCSAVFQINPLFFIFLSGFLAVRRPHRCLVAGNARVR